MEIQQYRVQLVRENSPKYCVDKFTSVNVACKEVKNVLKHVLQADNWHNERIILFCLDNSLNCVGIHTVSEGTVNECNISNREIILRTMLNNATNIIVAHNHFGGIEPSQADIKFTKSLAKATKTVGVQLVDHMIYCDDDIYSMKNNGLF